MKISTQIRYRQILRLWRAGREPKEIVRQLPIFSIHVVYKALRWQRKRAKFG